MTAAKTGQPTRERDALSNSEVVKPEPVTHASYSGLGGSGRQKTVGAGGLHLLGLGEFGLESERNFVGWGQETKGTGAGGVGSNSPPSPPKAGPPSACH